MVGFHVFQGVEEVNPIPVLPPLVGTTIGIVLLLVGLFLRFLGV
ncbi:hypothetical protein [Natronolimnohabitans innermongolicus]|nr:hypothetical protein [Natronolimnohabitans innermongolicus]